MKSKVLIGLALLVATVTVYAQEPAVFQRGLVIIRGNLTVSTGSATITSGTLTVGSTSAFTSAPTGGDAGYGHQFNINPVAGTAGLRQGGLDINLNRAATAALTAWDGNPDTAVNIRADNRGNNTAGGGIRALDASARNRGTNQTWVRAFEFNGRNDSGASLTDSLVILHLRAENYGNIATALTGIDLELSDENSTSDPHTKTGILIRNTDASAMGAVDEVFKVSHTSTNGFTYLINFAATTGDTFTAGSLKNSSGSDILADAYISVVVAGTAYYIPLYNSLQ